MYIQVITLGSQELIEQNFYKLFFIGQRTPWSSVCALCVHMCVHTHKCLYAHRSMSAYGRRAVSDGLPLLVTLHVP